MRWTWSLESISATRALCSCSKVTSMTVLPAHGVSSSPAIGGTHGWRFFGALALSALRIHINRASQHEAQHKIYIAATVYWPRPLPGQRLGWWFAYDRMHIYVVYEVLFHFPPRSNATRSRRRAWCPQRTTSSALSAWTS